MNETIDEEKCVQLLDDFSKITFKKEKHPTFLKIINQHNRENAWSNILAFYFDPKREHKSKREAEYFKSFGERL
jgi:F0F1-type ATP synthase delta subunit